MSYPSLIIPLIVILVFASVGTYLSNARQSKLGAAVPSIIDYINRPGGQEVIVPNGTYVGGTTRTSHSDWLVLKAQTRGGVTIDLANTGLKLFDGSSKIIFVGFKFKNGTIQMAETSDIHFWYSEFTFPPDVWWGQYKAAGGKDQCDRVCRSTMYHMTNLLPTPFRIRNGIDSTSEPNYRIGIYGSDIYDTGDDGIFFYATNDARFEGLRIWNVDEKTYDPGRSYNDGSRDWFHNDGIQTTGGSSKIKILDSWVGQKIQWATETSLTSSEFRRLWLAGSGTVGQITAVNGSGKILGNLEEDIRVFANGQQIRSHDYFRTDFKDGVQKIWPNTHYEAGRFEMPATNINTTVPSGITVGSNGILTDLNQIKNHPDNPANKWRAAHPYESYRQYLGLGVPTPTYKPEDINQDGVVNLQDFSVLASNYGKATGQLSNPRADINQDGTVNLQDFSLLASKFGT